MRAFHKTIFDDKGDFSMKTMKIIGIIALAAVVGFVTAACNNESSNDESPKVFGIPVTGDFSDSMKTQIENVINYLTPTQQAYVKSNIKEIKIVEAGVVPSVSGTVFTIGSDSAMGPIWVALNDWLTGKGISMLKQLDNSAVTHHLAMAKAGKVILFLR